MAALLLQSACFGTSGKPLDTTLIETQPSFVETFDRPLAFYDATIGTGRWKTNYWFGNQADATSRTYPQQREIYVDPRYVGIDPFELGRGDVSILVRQTSGKTDPRLAGKDFTGGILTTEPSFAQRYGYFEATMALPEGAGFWPAFWLWSQKTAVENEIDVVEGQTLRQDRAWQSLHFRGVLGADDVPVKIAETPDTTHAPVDDISKPHRYGVLWTPRELVWFVDDKEVKRRDNPGVHDPMFLILTNGVGGWEKGNGNPTRFPGRLRIYDVRAYRLKNSR